MPEPKFIVDINWYKYYMYIVNAAIMTSPPNGDLQ